MLPKVNRPLKVFLCHAHADVDAVHALYKRLKRAGVDAWLDKENLLPGSNWDNEIRKAVREADIVIVCLSRQFNSDGYRQKEVKIALETAMEKREETIFIIPARLEECEILESLSKWQWVDLFKEIGWQNLIRVLRVRADNIGTTLRTRIPTQPKESDLSLKENVGDQSHNEKQRQDLDFSKKVGMITVIVADDHPVVRDGLHFLLDAQRDMKVIGTAVNGLEAVELAKRLNPDIVIMDIAMPLMNGIEATQQIRAECPSTQVMILSTHFTSVHIQRALQAGAMGYLIKESAGEEVVEAIRTIHEGKRYLSRKIAETVVNDYVRQGDNDVLKGLSPRERQVLQLVAEGKTSAEAAQILYLSVKTVETFRRRFMQKLGLKDMTALVKFAIQHGIISLEQ